MRKQTNDFEEREFQGGGNLWLPDEEGEELEGWIYKIGVGQFGPLKVTLLTVDGEKIVLPERKNLIGKLLGLKEGMYVRIVYEGFKKWPWSKGRYAHGYRVFIKRNAPPMPEVEDEELPF